MSSLSTVGPRSGNWVAIVRHRPRWLAQKRPANHGAIKANSWAPLFYCCPLPRKGVPPCHQANKHDYELKVRMQMAFCWCGGSGWLASWMHFAQFSRIECVGLLYYLHLRSFVANYGRLIYCWRMQTEREGALMQCGDSFHIIMSADVVGRVWGRWVYNQYVAIRDRFSFNH